MRASGNSRSRSIRGSKGRETLAPTRWKTALTHLSAGTTPRVRIGVGRQRVLTRLVRHHRRSGSACSKGRSLTISHCGMLAAASHMLCRPMEALCETRLTFAHLDRILSAGAGRHLSDIIEGAGHPPRLCWEGKLELTEPLRSADRRRRNSRRAHGAMNNERHVCARRRDVRRPEISTQESPRGSLREMQGAKAACQRSPPSNGALELRIPQIPAS